MVNTMNELRQLHLRGAVGAVRVEMWRGKEHLVVPCVALQEGVIHAVNASSPEFVSAAALERSYLSWNGHPLVLGHPVRDGRQVSAHDVELLLKHEIGLLRASHMRGTRLGVEALVDPSRLEALGQQALLADLRAGKEIEVSVGAFVKTLAKCGVHNGKEYKAEWLEVIPDHLAFLPGGRGACSLEMGCGAHRAAGEFRAAEMLVTDDDFVALAAYTVGDKVKVRKTGKLAVVKRSGDVKGKPTHWLALLDDPEREFSLNEDEIEPAPTEHPVSTTPPAKKRMAERLADAILKVLGGTGSGNFGHKKDVNDLDEDELDDEDDDEEDDDDELETTKKPAEKGGKSAEEREMAMTKEQRAAEIKTLTDCPCSGFTQDDVKMLESVSDERLTAFKAATEKRKADLKAAEDAKTAAEVKATTAAAEAAAFKAASEKQLTEEEYLKSAPESIRTLVADKKASDVAQKTALVAGLKTATTGVFTEEELNAKGIPELQKLAQLSKVDVAPDYSGKGLPLPRSAAEKDDFAPPDAYAPDLKTLKERAVH